MKGIVFAALEQVVTKDAGADAWDDLLAEEKLSGAYSTVGSYPDAELVALVGAWARRSGRTVDASLRLFGIEAAGIFHDRFSALFAAHSDTISFLRSLDSVVHREVRKLYPGAETPQFEVIDGGPGRVVLVYRSTKGLCALAEGLLVGSTAVFRERVEVRQIACVHHGDADCRFDCTFQVEGA